MTNLVLHRCMSARVRAFLMYLQTGSDSRIKACRDASSSSLVIQISLHYKCKDDFKNTLECKLFSHSPHILRVLMLCSHSEQCGK